MACGSGSVRTSLAAGGRGMPKDAPTRSIRKSTFKDVRPTDIQKQRSLDVRTPCPDLIVEQSGRLISASRNTIKAITD